ncbi:MAG: endonuclease III, partial [Chloroflexi bacterium]|nr:endonuclease III [Chloroflexota bacterium]
GQILKLLSAEYGKREWQPRQSPISVLVRTILSQNTSDRNSGRAFESLLASFDGWDDIADAGVGEIADSIRAGGLGEVKAGYIKRVLEEIRQKQGDFELGFLRRMSVDEARDWLRQLPGVGMKTASCVLLFALGMPALPVDTHIFRVARRLELVGPKVSVEKAHKLLEEFVPPDDVYQFHVLMIEHGRRVCKAQRPGCEQCVLRGLCAGCEELISSVNL